MSVCGKDMGVVDARETLLAKASKIDSTKMDSTKTTKIDSTKIAKANSRKMDSTKTTKMDSTKTTKVTAPILDKRQEAALSLLERDFALKSDAPTKKSYSYDASRMEGAPLGVLFARSTSEVSKIASICYEARINLVPRGAGSGMVGGAICPSDIPSIILSLEKLDEILEINPRDLSAHVQAGVINGALQEAASHLGLFFGADPASLEFSTIGGNIAANAGGIHALKYGCTRDNVLGLTVVMSDGSVAHFGHNTRKDSSGYNLSALFVGSEGTLGIITEAIVRLHHIKPFKAMGIASFACIEDALAFSDALLLLDPLSMEFMDEQTLGAIARFNKEIDIASIGSPTKDVVDKGRPSCIILFELESSFKEHLALQIEETRRLIARFALRASFELSDVEKNIRKSASQAITASGAKKLNNDITVPRSKLLPLFKSVSNIASRYGVFIPSFGHIGDGNMHINIILKDTNKTTLKRGEAAVRELLEVAISLGGTLSGEHGIGSKKREFIGLDFTKEEIGIMKNIKQALDPHNILNINKIF